MSTAEPRSPAAEPAEGTLRETADGIRTMGERLLASGLTPDQAVLARAIVEESFRLAGALSGADHRARERPEAIVERALSAVLPAAAARGIEFRLDEPGDLAGITVPDAAEVTAALQKLLTYAVERCDRGPLVIAVSVDGPSGENGDHRLVVSVHDAGPDPRPTQDDASGPLEWAAEAPGAAGARVEIRCTAESGTDLQLAFPCQVADAARAGGASSGDFGGACLLHADSRGDLPPAASAALEKPLSILLADDYAVNRMLQQAQLERLGYRVDTVANGEEVLRALGARAYDVVLLDLGMPVMGGLEAARRIRATPGGPRPFIAAVTASPLSDVRDELVAAGMDAYLPKPVNPGKLAALLGHAFDAGSGPAASPAAGARPEPVALALDPLYERLGDAADGLLRRVIPVFLRELPGRERSLRAAFDGADPENFGRLCHGLKGSSRSLGATDLALSCERLENRAYEGALPPAADLDALLALARRTGEALRRKLAELGG